MIRKINFSNVKIPQGWTAWQVELSRRVYVYGDNESGKSALVQAIQLLTRGAADDIAGRQNVKNPGLLLSLAPMRGAPGDELRIEGEDEKGSRAVFQLTVDAVENVTTGAFSTHKRHTTPWDADDVNPMAKVLEILTGEESKGRRTLFPMVAQVSRDDVANMLEGLLKAQALAEREGNPTGEPSYASALAASVYQAMYFDIEEKQQGTPAARTLAVVDYARKQEKAQSALAAAAQVVLTAGKPAEARPTPESKAAAKNWIIAATAAETLKDWDSLQAFSLQCAQTLQVQEAHQHHLEHKLADLEKALSGFGLAQSVLATIHASTESETNGDRVYCMTCGSLHPVRELAEREAWIQATTSQRRDELNQGIQRAREDIETSQRQQAPWLVAQRQCADSLRTKTVRLQAVGLTPESASAWAAYANGATVETAQAWELSQARLEGQWESYEVAQRNIVGALQQAAKYARLADALEAAISVLVSRGVEDFETKVQAFMPPGLKFGLQLVDGRGKEVFRVGLKAKDNKGNAVVDVAACGYQWLAVTVALCCVLAKHPEEAVVTIEERSLTPRAFSSLMTAWSCFPGQVIVTGTVPIQLAGVYSIDADAWFQRKPKVAFAVPVSVLEVSPAPETPTSTVELESELRAVQEAAPDVAVVEEKPKRKRRSKAEMAEFRAAQAVKDANAAAAQTSLVAETPVETPVEATAGQQYWNGTAWEDWSIHLQAENAKNSAPASTQTLTTAPPVLPVIHNIVFNEPEV